ncbi:hypothetical protein IMZ48_13790 [Candidatus Bathyarchaeota archaeon]|nr:hypothetical protein [Candidatus Bathyarchaeota archaeon]
MRAFHALSKMRVLCVAEKPSISKAVAGHLSGGTLQTVSSGPRASYTGHRISDTGLA